jgi:hypothetical protein
MRSDIADTAVDPNGRRRPSANDIA